MGIFFIAFKIRAFYFRKTREKFHVENSWLNTHTHTYTHNTLQHVTRIICVHNLYYRLYKTMFPTWDTLRTSIRLREEEMKKKRKGNTYLMILDETWKSKFPLLGDTTRETLSVLRTHTRFRAYVVSHAWTIRIAILYLTKWTAN